MKLLDIVVKKAIIPDLDATGRDAVIAEIVDALVNAGAINPELPDATFELIEGERQQRFQGGMQRGNGF